MPCINLPSSKICERASREGGKLDGALPANTGTGEEMDAVGDLVRKNRDR